ncbi:MAG: HEAT repeat domain-containing protein [Candidatus Rifleibacteriota bacterium]
MPCCASKASDDLKGQKTMIDKSEMTTVLEKYESFLSEAVVGVLRMIEDSNVKLERKLVDFLKGKNFPVQIDKLVEILGKLPPDSIREKVTESLWDLHSTFLDLVVFVGSEGSRQTAYLPLIRMMDREGHPHRAFAMASLCSFDFPEAVNTLVRKFTDFSSEMRWVTLILLKRRWDDKFVPVFLKALDDKDPEVVRVAVLALSKANATVSLSRIRSLLYHQSEIVVLTAINALVELGDREAATQLQELFLATSNQKVRATVVSAFGEITSPESLAFLEESIEDRDSRVRANAVIALKKHAEKSGHLPEQIISKIRSHLNDSDHRVKADCIQTLWTMGQSENVDQVEAMLLSDNEQARSAGAYICGKLKLFQLKKHLENLTADRSYSVRKMAALALLGLGNSGRDVLEQLIETGTADQQIIAAYAVGLSDDQAAIDKLIAQSRSGSEMAEMATGLLLKLSKPASN